MFGLGKPKRVTEWEADGEIEQIYHQIKQSLRVSGVNLNFRTWAGYPKYFSDLWAQVRPMVETRAFEEAADDLRAQAVGVAQNLTPLNSATRANPGESQSYQIKAALDLYHYVNPKLLLLTSAVKISLESNPTARTETGPSALIERGVPDRMYPMEMIEEEPDDPLSLIHISEPTRPY